MQKCGGNCKQIDYNSNGWCNVYAATCTADKNCDGNWQAWRKQALSVPASVEVWGARGNNANIINGIYKIVDGQYNGLSHWQKVDNADLWIVNFPQNSHWYVTNSENKDANNARGWMESQDSGSELPTIVAGWSVWTGSEWHPQPSVRLKAQECSSVVPCPNGRICDNFVCKAVAAVSMPVPPAPASPRSLEEAQRNLWRAALPRYSRALDTARARWRVMLITLIHQKQTSGEKVTTTGLQTTATGMSKADVAKLLEAAQSSGMMQFEITTSGSGNEQVVFKIAR